MPISTRFATSADTPIIAELDTDAYKDSLFRRAMFPDSKRINPGVRDQLDWFHINSGGSIESSACIWLLAVERDVHGAETVLGYAQWVPPREHSEPKEQNQVAQTPEELAEKKRKQRADLPSYLDLDAAMAANAEIETLLKESEEHFRGKDRANMWTLNAIAVDAKHRRKGVGRLLTQWGIDKANEAGKDIWLIAAPDGRPLYLSCGFKEVAEGSRCGEPQYIMTRFGH